MEGDVNSVLTLFPSSEPPAVRALSAVALAARVPVAHSVPTAPLRGLREPKFAWPAELRADQLADYFVPDTSLRWHPSAAALAAAAAKASSASSTAGAKSDAAAGAAGGGAEQKAGGGKRKQKGHKSKR